MREAAGKGPEWGVLSGAEVLGVVPTGSQYTTKDSRIICQAVSEAGESQFGLLLILGIIVLTGCKAVAMHAASKHLR